MNFVRLMSPAASSAMTRLRNCFRDIADVMIAFKKFDANNDGALSQQELIAGMKTTGMNFDNQDCANIFAMADLNQDGEISAIFALGDSDGDGKVSFAEFAQLVLPSARDKVTTLKKSFKGAQDIQAAFQRFDVNKDGKISCDELKNGLQSSGLRLNDQEVMTIFAMADVDGDGEISLEEFS